MPRTLFRCRIRVWGVTNLVLKQRLFTFRMNKGELLRDHISQFITLLNDLKNVEVHIDDKD
ncbi:hypothetical protein Gotur_029403 [Gossypium turneri]